MKHAVAVMVILAGWVVPGCASAAAPAVVSIAMGQVEAARAASDVWFPAARGAVMQPGDRLRTRAGSAEVKFADGSRVRLHASTLLAFDKLDAGPRHGTY